MNMHTQNQLAQMKANPGQMAGMGGGGGFGGMMGGAFGGAGGMMGPPQFVGSGVEGMPVDPSVQGMPVDPSMQASLAPGEKIAKGSMMKMGGKVRSYAGGGISKGSLYYGGGMATGKRTR